MEKVEDIVTINKITKEYTNHKGVFDVSFTIKKGEILGFLGPNGAGKTTTIRQLLGFIKPDRGECKIFGKDCFAQASEIQKNVGYLPGEIAFMEDMSGLEFIHFIAKIKRLENTSIIEKLIEYFELDARGKIKKMSKGMKQKIGLVCAFMQDAEVIILDEPTSGLDPLMQNKFVELLLEEKRKGKTILMSSHIFEEVEKTCDRVAIIREGRLMSVEHMEALKKSRRKMYDITFSSKEEAAEFQRSGKDRVQSNFTVSACDFGDVDGFLKEVSTFTVRDFQVHTQSLEELFLHYYGGDN